MRLIVPYTEKSVDQKAHLEADGLDPEYVYVGTSDTDYFYLLKDLWETKQDFILVEHDIFPWRGALKTFETCGEEWCGFPYLYEYSTWVIAQGCTRYRAEAMIKAPAVFQELEDAKRTHWGDFDWHMRQNLQKVLGHGPHEHAPAVIHLM